METVEHRLSAQISIPANESVPRTRVSRINLTRPRIRHNLHRERLIIKLPIARTPRAGGAGRASVIATGFYARSVLHKIAVERAEC